MGLAIQECGSRSMWVLGELPNPDCIYRVNRRSRFASVLCCLWSGLVWSRSKQILSGLPNPDCIYTVNYRSGFASVLHVAFADATLKQWHFYCVFIVPVTYASFTHWLLFSKINHTQQCTNLMQNQLRSGLCKTSYDLVFASPPRICLIWICDFLRRARCLHVFALITLAPSGVIIMHSLSIPGTYTGSMSLY